MTELVEPTVRTFSATEIRQLQGTAWATARLLGATFSEQCWTDLTNRIQTDLVSLPPPSDTTASSAISSDARVLIAHSRVVHLVRLMYEVAVSNARTHDKVIVLEENTLETVRKMGLCLWPFWLFGC